VEPWLHIDSTSRARPVPAFPPQRLFPQRAPSGVAEGSPSDPVDRLPETHPPTRGKRSPDDPSGAARLDITASKDFGWGAALPEHRRVKQKGPYAASMLVTASRALEPSRLLSYRARAAAKFILPPACNMASAFSG